MLIRYIAVCIFLVMTTYIQSQCFLVPAEVCIGACGPLFYLQSDPDGTTYEWSVSCGTITNETAANPHEVCFLTAGTCTIQVIITMPGELPDTCTRQVEVLPSSLAVVEENVCDGDSIEINGTYYVPGFYTDTIFGAAQNGCDSILLITVDTIPADTSEITYQGCANDGFSIEINGETYDESNPVGIEIMPGTDGCDSVILINLQFLPPVTGNEIYFGCHGDGYTVVINGNIYNEQNPTGIDTLPAASGCDSIITISLTYFPPFMDTITYLGCSGDGFSVMLGDSIYNEGNPTGIHLIPGGCDTLIFIDLQFDSIHATLTLIGNQLCVFPEDLSYSWFLCDSTALPDTGNCVTVTGAGCMCVVIDDGTCIDTICQEFIACDITCQILTAASGCLGDSVLLQTDYKTPTAVYRWTVRNETDTLFAFTGTDSMWIVINHAGCAELVLEIEDQGCEISCSGSICIGERPIADLCCNVIECGNCATLHITLFGNSPLTIAISDGNSIDTISGITSSQYDHIVCPPANTSVIYTLLWVQDSTGLCAGGIINDAAMVYLEETPDATIITVGDSLCAATSGVIYRWTNCNQSDTLSTSPCFVPLVSGCYCLTVSSLLAGCTDSTCMEVVITSTDEADAGLHISYRYDVMDHAVVIDGISFSDTYEIMLHDVQGRRVPVMGQQWTGSSQMTLYLPDHSPSFLIITLAGEKQVISRGLFVPR